MNGASHCQQDQRSSSDSSWGSLRHASGWPYRNLHGHWNVAAPNCTPNGGNNYRTAGLRLCPRPL